MNGGCDNWQSRSLKRGFVGVTETECADKCFENEDCVQFFVGDGIKAGVCYIFSAGCIADDTPFTGFTLTRMLQSTGTLSIAFRHKKVLG